MAYERGLDRFVTGALHDAAFVDAVRPLAERAATIGALHALAQVVLKAASPGVPDTYQGADLWDLSLVDPDNRRPVDFDERRTALAALDAAGPPAPPAGGLEPLLRGWTDGRAKLYALSRALRERREDPALFLEGDYEPLAATGAHAERVVAFARRYAERTAVVVVPRLASAMLPPSRPGTGLPPLRWGDTALRLPPAIATRSFVDVFTGRRRGPSSRHRLDDALATFPVALWLDA